MCIEIHGHKLGKSKLASRLVDVIVHQSDHITITIHHKRFSSFEFVCLIQTLYYCRKRKQMLSHSIVLCACCCVCCTHSMYRQDMMSPPLALLLPAKASSEFEQRTKTNVHNKNALLRNTDVSMRLLYSFHWFSVQPITSLHVWHCHKRRHAIHHPVSFIRTPTIHRRRSSACVVHNNFKSLKQIFVRYLCVYWNCHQTDSYTFHLRQGNWIDRVLRSQSFKRKKVQYFHWIFSRN